MSLSNSTLTLSGHIIEEAERMPGYLEFFQKTWVAFNEFGYNFKKYPVDPVFTKNLLLSVKLEDVIIYLILAAVFSLVRHLMTVYVSIPLVNYLKLTESNKKKFPESVWRCLSYTFLWLYSLYVVILSGKHDFFHSVCRVWRPKYIFDDVYLTQSIPVDVYWMYALQTGFYLHCMYATLYVDTWRKDSIILIVHHVLTLTMLEVSFLMKYYTIGAMVLFLHDISDVILEFTKCCVYLKVQGKKKIVFFDRIASVGFLLFTASWAVFRLYWYPLKVLHATNWCAYIHQVGRDPKMYLFLNVMMFMLMGMHIYWFYFIILLLYKIATGQMTEVDDTREYDVEAETKQAYQAANGSSDGIRTKSD